MGSRCAGHTWQPARRLQTTCGLRALGGGQRHNNSDNGNARVFRVHRVVRGVSTARSVVTVEVALSALIALHRATLICAFSLSHTAPACNIMERHVNVKPLSRSAIHNRTQHEFVGGFLNVAYQTGYVHSWDPDKGLLMLLQSNNVNNALPIQVPPSVKAPVYLRKHLPIKVVGYLTGAQLQQDGGYSARLLARGFTRPTVLELPNANAFRKPPTGEQSVTEGGEVFKPYGSGNILKQSGNVVEVAGIVVAWEKKIIQPSPVAPEGATYYEVIVRNASNPRQAIPVRLYKSAAAQTLQSIKTGMPVVILGKYRVGVVPALDGDQQIVNENGELQFRRVAYIDGQLPMLAGETEILDLAPGRELPSWATELANAVRPRRRLTSVADTGATLVELPPQSETATVSERGAIAAMLATG